MTKKSIVILILSVIVLWVMTPLIFSWIYPVTQELTIKDVMAIRGQAGDIYGSVNALFSGLAFVGVVVAIALQSQELALQRKEIAPNREELSRTANAQEQTFRTLSRTADASVFKTAVDILQSDGIRRARGVVMQLPRYVNGTSWDMLEIVEAEKVCQSYDSVGLLVKWHLLPAEMIVDSWGDSLIKTWKILQPLVNEYRVVRQAPETWDDFEYLVKEALAYRERKNLLGM
jgi:hypothetical protein